MFYVSRFKWFNNTYEDWVSMRKRPNHARDAEALSQQLASADAVAPTADNEDSVKYKNAVPAVWISSARPKPICKPAEWTLRKAGF